MRFNSLKNIIKGEVSQVGLRAKWCFLDACQELFPLLVLCPIEMLYARLTTLKWSSGGKA